MLYTRAMSSVRAAEIQIVELDRAEIAVEPWRWPFAQTRRGEIDRHFAARQRVQPALWNGRVLLLNRFTIAQRVLHGASFETDYASFLAWREWNCADAGVFNIFAAAALRSADGGYLVGRMGPSTSIAGLWLFPCGTPDPKDISAAGTLDLAGSVGRELFEETGLDIVAFAAEPGWTLIRDGGFIALIKSLVAAESAEQLRADVMRHLANEAQPELSDIRFLRSPADFDPAMPRFVKAYLERIWPG
jgi:8-oxo-dGTP pyrophosphatase MutT (NUDIX family)